LFQRRFAVRPPLERGLEVPRGAGSVGCRIGRPILLG
jgi:hypothetical protein